ncbi:YdcF family protein [Caenimonas aquaedulcis]|uniref:YdcF family protein n=1 Tax=Caenimonas aquaedulcis TaxID=2793270 RepID=A0A931H5L6_9BURK|nr:YdcF family protein [Caenimonas aquaedulcis]MBG9389054.1 YdcF family protein [Caenimonas aquaedulcis]
MFEIAKVAGYLLSPLTVVLALGLLAMVFAARRKARRALVCGAAALALLWVASLPIVAEALVASIESRYPARPAASMPRADAILVLGGALGGAWPPLQPTFTLGPSAGRVWEAAALYRAGKAPWVVISGGNQPGTEAQQAEGDAIAQMLTVLGVPAQAIRRETASRNTWENAANVRSVLRAVGAKRILFVTSALHMPRAVKTFEMVWAQEPVELIAYPTDIQVPASTQSLKVWLPSLESLLGVTKALKEIAGMWGLAIMH